MSSSTPVCRPFCSKCKAESRKSLRHYDRDHVRDYLDIEIVGGNADVAILQCKKCGHTYDSTSRAAMRMLRRFQARQNQ